VAASSAESAPACPANASIMATADPAAVARFLTDICIPPPPALVVPPRPEPMDTPLADRHLECVLNVSEGARPAVVAAIAAAAGRDLLDVHRDRHHNRSVLTLLGEDAPRAVAREAVERLDLRRHRGVHPRIGVVDVVPFVPLAGATLADAVAARDW